MTNEKRIEKRFQPNHKHISVVVVQTAQFKGIYCQFKHNNIHLYNGSVKHSSNKTDINRLKKSEFF